MYKSNTSAKQSTLKDVHLSVTKNQKGETYSTIYSHAKVSNLTAKTSIENLVEHNIESQGQKANLDLGTGPTTRPISRSTGDNNVVEHMDSANEYYDPVLQNDTVVNVEGHIIDARSGLVAYNKEIRQSENQLILSNSAMIRASQSLKGIKIDTKPSRA